jgi:hypothetical protein
MPRSVVLHSPTPWLDALPPTSYLPPPPVRGLCRCGLGSTPHTTSGVGAPLGSGRARCVAQGVRVTPRRACGENPQRQVRADERQSNMLDARLNDGFTKRLSFFF